MPRGLLCALLVLPALISDASAADFTVERVVMVSRHGVRSPTDSASLAHYVTGRSWPDWQVPDGYLTSRGATLVSRMGEYYRQAFVTRGLLPPNGCPTPNQIYVWADIDQRTVHTGQALLAGAFPDCPLVAQHADGSDSLFHPLKGKDPICTMDKDKAEEAVKKRVGGPLKSKLEQKPYSEAMTKLQGVLGCCSKEFCKKYGLGDRCVLKDLPSKINGSSEGVHLEGPISIGSTTSEVFLLEYGQGKTVAWGYGATANRLMLPLELHDLQFDLAQRTEYVARRQGSALLQQVLETLRQTVEGNADLPRPVPLEAKVVIYVGHDTNLANFGGVLDVSWKLASYNRNETPPAGAMAFELLREKGSGQYFIRLTYHSQTPDQMRQGTPLDAANPVLAPNVAPITVDHYCRGAAKDGACPWTEFYHRVGFGSKEKPNPKPRLDPECVLVKPN